MSATRYYEKINDLLARIHASQGDAIAKAAGLFSECILADKPVYLF